MLIPKSNEEMREFCEAWNSPVFTFCRLFLGDEVRAQSATEQAFVDYIRSGFALRTDRIPFLLLRSAVQAAKTECSAPRMFTSAQNGLEEALGVLPCEARCVFILRSVLGFETAAVTVATGQTTEQVDGLWMQALLQLRACWLEKG